MSGLRLRCGPLKAKFGCFRFQIEGSSPCIPPQTNDNHCRPPQGSESQPALAATTTTTSFVCRVGYHPPARCATWDFRRSPCARIRTNADRPAATSHSPLLRPAIDAFCAGGEEESEGEIRWSSAMGSPYLCAALSVRLDGREDPVGMVSFLLRSAAGWTSQSPPFP